jgi:hypothetical protein
MIEVIEALSLLKDVVLLYPAPVCGAGTIILATLQMMQCDDCDEWYHYKCAGICAADICGDAEFECSVVVLRLQVWAGDVYHGRKQVVIPDRNPTFAPEKRSKNKGGHQEWFGLRS